MTRWWSRRVLLLLSGVLLVAPAYLLFVGVGQAYVDGSNYGDPRLLMAFRLVGLYPYVWLVMAFVSFYDYRRGGSRVCLAAVPSGYLVVTCVLLLLTWAWVDG